MVDPCTEEAFKGNSLGTLKSSLTPLSISANTPSRTRATANCSSRRNFSTFFSNSFHNVSTNIAAKWSQFQYTLYCIYIDYEREIAKNKVKLQVTKDYR